MKTWAEFEKELNISPEDEKLIEMEVKLLEAMVAIREKQGLSQAELAKKCNVKQPVIARLEKSVHSPQLNTILKVLIPLGYTLQIVPIEG